ncbi:hypothetical protein K1T71_008695 [Dendrolimus kikuchii]|uniref:Uncharacterized protein n=1 Tax=Dendrolimus kikuchii TaxID=765133 RepID=A0ACC1CVD4_9NEOP|nr:hypothetical protein K1T71_008695 [Dendrolimus kikuchii]
MTVIRQVCRIDSKKSDLHRLAAVLYRCKLDIKQRLSSIVQGRILTFFGHITRREDTSVERLVVQGKVEGTRARGRSPMRWTDQIKSALNGPLHECTRKATVREEWRRIVKLATTPVMRTTTTLPRV